MSRPLNADAALCEKSLSVSLCLTFYFSARSLPASAGVYHPCSPPGSPRWSS